ncbi:hypothetical protein FRC16_005407 [Serendipita sp. 398]|nr:hypothetical protein FRC16_005407 [Serendipita sp. 398]
MPASAMTPTFTRRKSREYARSRPTAAIQPEHDDQAETSLAPWWNLDAIIDANSNLTPFRKQKYDALKWLNEELLVDEDGAEFLVDDRFATPGYQSVKKVASTKRKRSSLGNSHLKSSSRRTSAAKHGDLTLADLTPRSRRVSALVRISGTPRRSEVNTSRRPPLSSARRKSFTPRAQLDAIQENSPRIDGTFDLHARSPARTGNFKSRTPVTPLSSPSKHAQRKGEATSRTISRQDNQTSTRDISVHTSQLRRKSQGRSEVINLVIPPPDESSDDEELHRSIPGAFDFVPARLRTSSSKMGPNLLFPLSDTVDASESGVQPSRALPVEQEKQSKSHTNVKPHLVSDDDTMPQGLVKYGSILTGMFRSNIPVPSLPSSQQMKPSVLKPSRLPIFSNPKIHNTTEPSLGRPISLQQPTGIVNSEALNTEVNNGDRPDVQEVILSASIPAQHPAIDIQETEPPIVPSKGHLLLPAAPINEPDDAQNVVQERRGPSQRQSYDAIPLFEDDDRHRPLPHVVPYLSTDITGRLVDRSPQTSSQPLQRGPRLLASPKSSKDSKKTSLVTKPNSKKRPLELSPNKPVARAPKRQHVEKTAPTVQGEGLQQQSDRQRVSRKEPPGKATASVPKQSERAPEKARSELHLRLEDAAMPSLAPTSGHRELLPPLQSHPRNEKQRNFLPPERIASPTTLSKNDRNSLRNFEINKRPSTIDQEDVFGRVMENSVDISDERSWIRRRDLPVEIFESVDEPRTVYHISADNEREVVQAERLISQTRNLRGVEKPAEPILTEASRTFNVRNDEPVPPVRLSNWHPSSASRSHQVDRCTLTVPVSPKFILGHKERRLEKAERQKSRDERLVRLQREPKRGDRHLPPVAAKLLATLAGLQADLKAPTQSGKSLPSQEFTFISEFRPSLGLQGAKEVEQVHKEQFATRRNLWEQRSLADTQSSTTSSNDGHKDLLANRPRAPQTNSSTHLHYRSTSSTAAKAIPSQQKVVSRQAVGKRDFGPLRH